MKTPGNTPLDQARTAWSVHFAFCADCHVSTSSICEEGAPLLKRVLELQETNL